MKRIAVIPTLLTLGNAVCGFASIACASKVLPGSVGPEGDYYFWLSGWLIIGAMLFDALDGHVARLSRTASPFGVQLDSLCDAISFGVAPAFLLLRLGPGWEPVPRLHQALAVIAMLYMVCAILRLARFNVEAAAEPGTSKRFRGLPSPAAAGCLAALAILRGGLVQHWPGIDPEIARTGIQIWAPLGALTVALLMVSRVSYPHLTEQILGRRPFRHLVQIVVAFAIFWLVPDLTLTLVFWLYALAFPLRYLWARSLRHGPDTVPATALDDPLAR